MGEVRPKQKLRIPFCALCGAEISSVSLCSFDCKGDTHTLSEREQHGTGVVIATYNLEGTAPWKNPQKQTG